MIMKNIMLLSLSGGGSNNVKNAGFAVMPRFARASTLSFSWR
jgi:hypothetical protein